MLRKQASLSVAMRLLDIPRRIRQIERKLPTANVRKQRALRQQLNDLRNEDVPEVYSVSRSFTKVAGRLLGSITPDRLEFDLLFYENGPWRGFCDLLHLSPKLWKLGESPDTALPRLGLRWDTDEHTHPSRPYPSPNPSRLHPAQHALTGGRPAVAIRLLPGDYLRCIASRGLLPQRRARDE